MNEIFRKQDAERMAELERRIRLLCKFVPASWLTLDFRDITAVVDQPTIIVKARPK